MSYKDIAPADLTTLTSDPSLVIFDTRDPGSYARGHLEGAAPVSDAALMQLIRARQRERPILVYCYRGNSSRDMCQLITGMGFSQVYNLTGGWEAWMAYQQSLAAVANTITDTNSNPAATSEPLTAWMATQGFPEGGIHARITNGMSPLMMAALKGELALVEELIALGADPNHVNDDDHHALWFACVHGDTNLVKLLIDHGANVDNQNVNGATCAIYTASTGKLEVLKILVEAGADLSKETTGGYTALESASTWPVLKYLRNYSAELDTAAMVKF